MAQDFKPLFGIGGKLNDFQSLLDSTAEDLPPDHPQKQLLQRLSSMFRAQRAAVGDALARFNEVATEHVAKAKADLAAFEQEFAPVREKLQRAAEAAQAAPVPDDEAPAAPPEAPPLPHLDVDPSFGTELGKELLERYQLHAKSPPKSFDDREIWQDWT